VPRHYLPKKTSNKHRATFYSQAYHCTQAIIYFSVHKPRRIHAFLTAALPVDHRLSTNGFAGITPQSRMKMH
jgi:hypothetical protein